MIVRTSPVIHDEGTLKMTTKHLDLSVLEDLPLEQLQAAQEKLAALLQRQQDGKKREALKEIRELTIRHELTFEEVVAAVRTTTKRAKAPALFRNPDNPRQTWSGKGEAPSWFKLHPNPEKLRIPGA
jgi:DNA-binding protein H-NS